MKKLREKLNNKKGFTLVELIVVIVIILVLAAVLVPNVLKYIEKANQANCKSDAATTLTQLQAEIADLRADGKTTNYTSQIGVATGATVDSISTSADSGTKVYQYVIEDDETDANYGSITQFFFANGTYCVAYDVNQGWSSVVKCDGKSTCSWTTSTTGDTK